MTFGDIIRKFKLETSNSRGFYSQGRGTLWVCDVITDEILLVDKYGRIIERFAAPATAPQGITQFDGHLFSVDWSNGRAYMQDMKGNVIRTGPVIETGLQDLTTDGKRLYTAKGSRVFEIDPRTLILRRTYTGPFPAVTLVAIEYIGANQFVFAETTNKKMGLAYLSGDRFRLIRSANTPGIIPAAIAFDGKYLWHNETGGVAYQISMY